MSLVVGNLFYARQALRLARATGRTDVCALPYGINTVSLFAYVFLVMLPAKLAAEAAGAADPARVAWQAGLVACIGSGLIELGGAFVAERVRRATPRAALLSTLAGIALTFISLGFLFRDLRAAAGRAHHARRSSCWSTSAACGFAAACPAGWWPWRSARCSPG